MARMDTTWLTRVSAVLCIFGEFRNGPARMHAWISRSRLSDEESDRVCMCAV